MIKPITYNDIDLEEIIHVLLSIFGSASYHGSTTIFFPGRNYDKRIIQIQISKKNKITLVPTHRCDSKTLQRIKEKIKTDIYSYEVKIGRDILFSSYIPLYGYFRYRDVFQIIPVPPQAPKPEYIAHGPHPILLEFAYKKSNDGGINTYRIKKASYEIAWILNLLLNTDISNREYRVNTQWVRCEGEPISRLCNTEYVFEDIDWVIDKFSDVSDLKEIKFIEPTKYYGRGQDVSKGIRAPTIINELLDIVFSLDREKYNHLMTACKFLSLSNKLWESSQSMAYLAAISAIESIPKESDNFIICSECRKPKNGPTKQFKDFLEKYGPKLSSTNITKKKLYDLRSEIVHRGFLFESDSNPWSFFGSPEERKQESDGIALRRIVQIALIRWLILTGRKNRC
jgi:hypothetical protein